MAQHHPLGDIEYLRENLLHSYKLGFPIIKELVQNAEDAQATCLDYGWIRGIPKAQHPLLKTPALFMLDNGNFTEENAKAIRYILGGSSKPSQQDSIGKFGLGLKSVFHLCEAFFYIAPEAPNSKYRRWDIFNPWAGAENKDDYHENWDITCFENFENDKELIKGTLSPILNCKEYQSKWFILWIPLRQYNHKTTKDFEDGIELGWIKKGNDDFFEEIPEFFKSPNTKEQLSLLMNLLRTVEKIRYWEGDFSTPQFSIVLQPNAQRRSVIAQLNVNNEHSLEGEIVADNQTKIRFTGSEIISDFPIFSELKSKNDFPGKFREIKPHNAIVFSCLQSKQKKKYLVLRTAVFLPIGEDEVIECQSQNSYYFTFHGYFFVDFARTGVMGWDASTSTLKKRKLEGDDSTSYIKKSWNSELFNFLLNKFLSQLQEFFNEHNLATEEIQAICTALFKSKFFQNNRDIICQNEQLVYCLNPAGNQWRLLNKDTKILLIPEEPDWDLFPQLRSIADQESHILTTSDFPNLMSSDFPNTTWSDQGLKHFLDNIELGQVFRDSLAIKYVHSFLDANYSEKSDLVENSLITLFRKIIKELKFSELFQDKIKDSLQKLLYDFIDFRKIIYLDCPENVFKELSKDGSITVLLMPKQLANEAKNMSQLNYDDSLRLLRTIENWILNEQIRENTKLCKIISNLIIQILKLSKNKLHSLLRMNPELKCLPATSYTDQKLNFHSYNELKEITDKRCLFKLENDYLRALCNATNDLKPFIVNREMTSLLNHIPGIEPKDCNADTCKEVLATAPELAQSEQRTELLNKLI